METLFTLSALALGSIPVTIGLVAVVRKLGLATRLAPAFALLIGVGLIALTGATWQVSVAQGLLVGLTACGLYSGVKTTV